MTGLSEDEAQHLVLEVAEKVRTAAREQAVLVLDPVEAIAVWGFMYMSGYPYEIDGSPRREGENT